MFGAEHSLLKIVFSLEAAFIKALMGRAGHVIGVGRTTLFLNIFASFSIK